MKYQSKLFTLFIIIFSALTASAQKHHTLPSLAGEDAIKKLRQTGGYDSLMEAVEAARKENNQTEDPPEEDAIGESAKLIAADGADFDQFGYSVAISGDTAIIGAYTDDVTFVDQGSAYIFVRSGTSWTQQQRLTASDPAHSDQFGTSVAISGDTVVVGARVDDITFGDQGSAYVFVRSGNVWTQQQKLTASDAAPSDFFGSSVAISGDTVIIGAQEDDGTFSNQGSAYIFARSGITWTLQQKLTASDGVAFDFFGLSVAISGDTAIVGAWSDDEVFLDQGSAYVFVRSGATWTQQQKINNPDPAASDFFGYSVAISGDTAIVGSRRDDATFTDQGLAYVFIRSGSTWTQQQKLTASDAAANDDFGISVAISGDTVIVGAFADDVTFNNQGSAYIFVRSGSTWTQQQKLTASDAAEGDNFGINVAISGTNMIVGANQDNVGANSDQGSAYTFRFLSNSWTQEARKVADDGAASDNFGFSVAISGDTAIVGALLDDGTFTDQGSAYIFVRSGTTWTQQQKINNPDPATEDFFGYSVAISGDTVIIGAYQDDVTITDQGSAYIFVRFGSTWTQQQKLTASDAADHDNFGFSVAISGDTVIVGAWSDDGTFSAQGSAYIFVRSGSTWTQQQKLDNPDSFLEDFFGFSVAISGDTVVIGARLDNVTFNNQGSAYIFVRSGSTWTQQQKLTASDAAEGDEFGYSVAISGDTVIIGAWADDVTLFNEGSAYVFVRSNSTWTLQQKLTAPDPGAIDEFGISVAIDGDTVIIGAPLDETTFFNQGAAFIFVRSGSTWTQQQKLTASDAAASDTFGNSVAISGDKVIVGALFSDASNSSPLTENGESRLAPSAVDQGAMYVFVNAPFAPTASHVSISGRVITPQELGLTNALVTLTNTNGESKQC